MVHLRSPQEVDKIRRSSEIASDTLQMVKELVRPGVTTRELDREAEKYIRGQGAEPAFKGLYGFPATLCVSIEDEIVHGIPSEVKLQEGQIVGFDVGAIVDGYYGDHALTFAVGTITDDRQKLMDNTRECLDLAIMAAHSGGTIGDIGHAVQNHAESAGYSVVRELVGHGVGTRLHEEPQVPNYGEPGGGLKLQEGMVLAIEPMINIGTEKIFTEEDGWTIKTADGAPSAHFEHTIAITSNGAEVLSAYK